MVRASWTRASLFGIQKCMQVTHELNLASCVIVDNDVAVVLIDLQCLECLVLNGCQNLYNSMLLFTSWVLVHVVPFSFLCLWSHFFLLNFDEEPTIMVEFSWYYMFYSKKISTWVDECFLTSTHNQ
jgi:hypothetical protein